MTGSGVVEAVRAPSRLLDVAVAAGVFAYNLPVQGLVGAAPTGDPLTLLVPLGLCAPWLVRRTRPVTALGIMLAAAVVQMAIGLGPLVADVMLPLGVFAVARRRTWTVSVPALLVVTGWAAVSFGPRLDTSGLTLGDLLAFVVGVVAAWLWGTLARTRAAYVATLHDRLVQAEREKEAEARLATVAERTRIARELHDIVSHHLSAIGLLSDGAASTVADDPDRAADAMRSVRDTSRTAMAEMRSMLSVLREDAPGDHAPAPGVADLPGLVDRARGAGVPVELSTEGDVGALAPGTSLAVYRIVQEALTNVRRHAGPDVSRVEVAVRADGDGVRVLVQDDGSGLPERGSDGRGIGDPAPTGHGLVGMRERAAALDGTLEAGPGPAGGFRVAAALPLSPHPLDLEEDRP